MDLVFRDGTVVANQHENITLSFLFFLSCWFFVFWGFFLLRKTSPELTPVLIFLYFICGTPAMAWLDKWCVGPHLGSEPANPGLWKQNM